MGASRALFHFAVVLGLVKVETGTGESGQVTESTGTAALQEPSPGSGFGFASALVRLSRICLSCRLLRLAVLDGRKLRKESTSCGLGHWQLHSWFSGLGLRTPPRALARWEWLTDDVLRLDVSEHCLALGVAAWQTAYVVPALKMRRDLAAKGPPMQGKRLWEGMCFREWFADPGDTSWA